VCMCFVDVCEGRCVCLRFVSVCEGGCLCVYVFC
jgi:hypothetical protein